MPELRGTLEAECADGAAVLVPHGRPGPGAVHAGGRGRSRVFPRSASIRQVPVLVVGLGSNLLVRDGGCAASSFGSARASPTSSVEPGHRVRAGAGAPDVKVARAAAEAGIAGLSFLRGIPGTIGGALRMNGGAYGGETKDVLVEARGVDRAAARR